VIKNIYSKFIVLLCLSVYILFGFLNTGNIGFCIGNNTDPHCGLILGGYETCCHDNIYNHQTSNTITIKRDCNDVAINTSCISQLTNSVQNVNYDLLPLNILSFYVIPRFINLPNSGIEERCDLDYSPPDCISFYSDIIKKSTVLLI
jgi:hypothetical protein